MSRETHFLVSSLFVWKQGKDASEEKRGCNLGESGCPQCGKMFDFICSGVPPLDGLYDSDQDTSDWDNCEAWCLFVL